MQRKETDVLQQLQSIPGALYQYQQLEDKWRQRFMDYCTGKKTLPITYDPFFKRIFHPDLHPRRLSRFLSSILGRKVRVVRILPTEEYMLDGNALLIMDILVELEDGSLVNVEIQKVPYLFPGQRLCCYSSDLVLRQYSRVKGEKGAAFKYSDMRPVYTIVIYEKSTAEFHMHPGTYLHHGKVTFDTGLTVDLLQEYWLIALDVFRKIPYSKDKDTQTAWLSLLAAEDVEDIRRLVRDYPWMKEICDEMEGYMHKPEEVLNMFSEALKILDRNTVQYMIEQQQVQIEDQIEQILEQQNQIGQQQAQIGQQEVRIEQQQNQIGQQQAQIGQQQAQIGQQQAQIEVQNEQLQQQQAEIARLKSLLENQA